MKIEGAKKPRRRRNPNAKPKVKSKPAPILLADFHRLHPRHTLRFHFNLDTTQAESVNLISEDSGKLIVSRRKVEDVVDWVEGRIEGAGRQIAHAFRESVGLSL
jgi:hypothetical protein